MLMLHGNLLRLGSPTVRGLHLLLDCILEPLRPTDEASPGYAVAQAEHVLEAAKAREQTSGGRHADEAPHAAAGQRSALTASRLQSGPPNYCMQSQLKWSNLWKRLSLTSGRLKLRR